jgi:hypothetical protein
MSMWPALSFNRELPHYPNAARSGLLVLKPSLRTLSHLLQQKAGKLCERRVTDQSVLNAAFGGPLTPLHRRYGTLPAWHRLPWEYNVPWSACNQSVVVQALRRNQGQMAGGALTAALSVGTGEGASVPWGSARAVHFIGEPKPWELSPTGSDHRSSEALASMAAWRLACQPEAELYDV